MTVEAILEEIRALPLDERARLVKMAIDMLVLEEKPATRKPRIAGLNANPNF